MSVCYIPPENVNMLLTVMNQFETITLRIVCMLSKTTISCMCVDHDRNMCIMSNIPCDNQLQTYESIFVKSTEIVECMHSYLDGIHIIEANSNQWKLSNGRVITAVCKIPVYIQRDIKLLLTPTHENKNSSVVIEISTQTLLSCFLYTAVCESNVTISFHKDGLLYFESCGELLALNISIHDYVVKHHTNQIDTITCTGVFKYIRAIVSTLQTYETLHVEIQNKSYTRIYTHDNNINSIFFHHTMKNERKRKYIYQQP